MRPILYRAVETIPETVDISGITKAQRDIVDKWVGHSFLFSVTQIAERNNIKRGQARRQIRQLMKMGIVSVWYDPKKNRRVNQ